MDWKRRRTLPGAVVRRVAIVGGTHGNEANGVHLAKYFLRNLATVQRPSFQTEVLLANTEAIENNTRYVEEDMNRCYFLADLADDAKAKTTKERKRAREVDEFLGPKRAPEPRCDLVIDLHNTTAATDVALMMAPDDDFAHELGYHLATLDKGVRVVNWNDQADWPLCPSVGRSGMTFEVGSCHWGCVVPDLFDRSKDLLLALLDYVEAHNKAIVAGATARETVSLPVYRSLGISIDYPRCEDGELDGMIHPERQMGDFRPLVDGDKLFKTFGGEEKQFVKKNYKIPEKTGEVYSVFVNEAAYYEKKIAVMLFDKAERKVERLSVASA